MSDRQWMKAAVDMAADVYRSFLDQVLERHVILDREPLPLPKETRKKLEKGLIVHPNPVRLLTISGKGGASKNGDCDEKYGQYFNITLLDHLLSTVRGALVSYSLKSLEENPEMDSGVLRRRLHVICAIAFLHDLDKDQGLPRNTPLSEELVRDAMNRYGIDPFLAGVGVHLEPDQMRYLIENTEATQSFRHPPKIPVPRECEPLPLAVRSIDQLDGAWCLDDPDKGGLAGVLDRVRNDRIFPGAWKPIRLYDPHHPFLLDELQRYLSRASRRITGIPPLIEVHRDGELFMLLPEERFDEVVQRAVEGLCAGLPFNLEVKVSNRGVPSLYNGLPGHDELACFIREDIEERTLLDIFKISKSLIDPLKNELHSLLYPLGLGPLWPKNVKAATTSLSRVYSSLEGIEGQSRESLYQAAHLALLLNLKIETPARSGIPSYEQREQELFQAIRQDCPDWIAAIQLKEPDPSRRVLTALWVTALARDNRELWESVWGAEGLLKDWLEGRDERPGFRDFITGRGSKVKTDLKRRLTQLLSGKRAAPESECEKGRCIFTDEPVPFDQTIDQALGLYGVKVSAFSGRDGRPELLTSESAHTNVSGTAIAEHKTRSGVHKLLGSPDDGVPALISSPTTSGLFGGLALAEDKAIAAMSIYDINRLDVKKGRIVSGSEIYRSRHRIARLERMPEKLTSQVDKIRLFLKAARRIGRPIHIFRGLPVPQRAFFHYDAMPRAMADLLGGNSLRLEQIPEALERLEVAQVLMDTNGLGYETFRRYANPKTRFGAICLAWNVLNGEKNPPGAIISGLAEAFLEHKEGNQMSELDGALVRFGRAAAEIQKRPAQDISGNEGALVFKIALDAVTAARRTQQVDEASLTYAVAGELETNLSRKNKTWIEHPEVLRKKCLDVAEVFVRDVWLGALKGRPPGQSDLRVLKSIYRMAFMMANRKS